MCLFENILRKEVNEQKKSEKIWFVREVKKLTICMEDVKMKALNCVGFLMLLILVSNTNAALVEHWSFDDAVGSAVAVGDNGNDGVLNGDITLTGPGGGKLGGAASFSGGVYDMMLPPTTTLSPIDDAVTIAYWVNGSDAQPSNNYMFAALNPLGWQLEVCTPNTQYSLYRTTWRVGTGLNYVSYWPSVASTPGDGIPSEYKLQWNHWAFTATADPVDGIDMKVYLNGDLVGSGSYAYQPISGQGISRFAIGNNPDGSYPWVGLLDDMYVFDTALSQSEIQALMVPEPTTLILLGLGGLISLRRKSH